MRILCEHLHLPRARQVEFKARIIAMTFAVNSTCQAKRMLQQMRKSMQILFCLRLCYDLGDLGGPGSSLEECTQTDFRMLFYVILVPKQIRGDLRGIYFRCLFLASLWGSLCHQFGRIWGYFGGFVLHSFLQTLQNLKNAAFCSELFGFRNVGPL